MASFAPRSANRKPGKLVKYGKASRSTYSTKHIDNFLEDDNDDSGHTNATKQTKPSHLAGRENSVKETMPVQKPRASKEEQKPISMRSKPVDTFDVPSSDEEVDLPVKRPSPPKLKARRNLVDDSQVTKLAPWEMKRPNPSLTQQKSALRTKSDGSKGTHEPQKKTSLPSDHNNAHVNMVSTSKNTRKTEVDLAVANEDSKPMSAMARLAQRRGLSENGNETNPQSPSKDTMSAPKRAVPEVDDSASTPRKRSRKGGEKHDRPSADHSSDDLPSCKATDSNRKSQVSERDILDVPDSSADESATSPPVIQNSATIAHGRRGRQIPSTSSRVTPVKGLSAPARLSEMLLADADNTEAPSRSPSEPLSRSSTPKIAAQVTQNSSTPASAKSSSPQIAIKNTKPVSRNSPLWDQMMPEEISAPSPSKLPMKDLNISATPTSTLIPKQRKLQSMKSSTSEKPRKRLRLVDRMKASAQPSSEDDSSESSDVDMEDMSTEPSNNADNKKPTRSSETSGLSTNSQSRSQASGVHAPAITYASARSYIQEDTLDDIMLDIGSTPQRAPAAARRTGQTRNASHKSEFDLEPSDDESGTGRIRTIHELRAAGRNRSFMLDTESLLEDIANHAVSARSRRRSAFVEIATKLADKAYAGRFLEQGFEDRLAIECTSTPDGIADPVLAVAISYLLAAEPPQHTLTSLKDHGVLPWLVNMASNDTEIKTLVKDRSNNMSKVAQGSMMGFFDSFQKDDSMWPHKHPEFTTPRLVSMKALELLVSRLRRLGDRTSFIPDDNLSLIARGLDSSDVVEASLSISVLEALSTSAQAISWPSKVLEQFALTLPSLETNAEMPRHTTFLALRLALNLTNDHVANCNLLAQPQTVDYLLAAIQTGFSNLGTPNSGDERDLNLDLLVLALGVMINVAEHSEKSRHLSSRDKPKQLLTAILEIFKQGQKNALDAESVEDTTTNVAFGYLAVMLANICQDRETRIFIRTKLPQQNLSLLVEAVREFVKHHERVDSESFENEEGREVWGAFTAKLRAVQNKLEAVDRND